MPRGLNRFVSLRGEGMPLYRNNMHQGGWFSFNAKKEDWKSHYAKKMYNTYFNSSFVKEQYGRPIITDELLITNNINYSGINDKSVLVIGGGPSCEILTSEIINSYDYVFSCNHFYKNELLNKHNIHVALLGDEVDLKDKKLLEYIQKNKTIIGFEHSSKRRAMDLLSFKKQHIQSFIYLTRYFSRLGYVARACVLAKLMGADNIDFVGLDGFKTNSHYFESTKGAPPFNNEKKFCDQMEVFYRYMLNDLRTEPERFNNLSDQHKDSIYGGILEAIKNETNK